jgi:hypothetical protein
VTGIDRETQMVALADGTELAYDALVLATGAAPFVPPVPGRDLPAFLGYVAPPVEVLCGACLLLGLATRYVGAVSALLMVVFIAGILSAMARGLNIDCGCFGGGGQVEPGETTYGISIARDIAFFAMGAFIAIWPRSPFALDRVLGLFR